MSEKELVGQAMEEAPSAKFVYTAQEARSMDDIVSRTKAVWTYIGMIAFAMVVSFPSPQGIIFAPMFPYGFAMFFRTESEGTGKVLPAVAYVIYLVLFFAFITLRTKKAFRIAVFVLAGVLLMNISGCHKMWDGFSRLT